jgi:predicted anti-sigma-YlaC factor YlaD
MLMNCKKTKHLLFEYLDKKPDQSVIEQIESHLVNCESCASIYNLSREIMGSVKTFSESMPETSDYFTARTFEKIKNSKTESFSPWIWIYHVLFSRVSVVTASFAGLIAGVLLGVILSSAYVEQHNFETASEEETVEDVYVAGMSDQYFTEFFDNQTHSKDGNK